MNEFRIYAMVDESCESAWEYMHLIYVLFFFFVATHRCLLKVIKDMGELQFFFVLLSEKSVSEWFSLSIQGNKWTEVSFLFKKLREEEF